MQNYSWNGGPENEAIDAEIVDVPTSSALVRQTISPELLASAAYNALPPARQNRAVQLALQQLMNDPVELLRRISEDRDLAHNGQIMALVKQSETQIVHNHYYPQQAQQTAIEPITPRYNPGPPIFIPPASSPTFTHQPQIHFNPHIEVRVDSSADSNSEQDNNGGNFFFCLFMSLLIAVFLGAVIDASGGD